MSTDDDELWESERLVSDAVGRLMEFWGFKRNMGRVWALLFLADAPMPSLAIQSRLGLSSGAVSMTMADLNRWGVTRKVRVAGERKDFFEAEGNFWKMISRVWRERERVEILDAIDVLSDALDFAERKRDASGDPATLARAHRQIARIRQLLELARLGRQLVEAFVQKGAVDASPLLSVLLGGTRES